MAGLAAGEFGGARVKERTGERAPLRSGRGSRMGVEVFGPSKESLSKGCMIGEGLR